MTHISNQDNIRAWSAFSQELIEHFGDEGDAARQYLLNPTLFELFGKIPGQRFLDAGCGTGYLCRLLAKHGAGVVGVEPAQSLYAYAVQREQAERLGITYLQKDLSLLVDYHDDFDVVVANMVLMDIVDYQPAMRNCIVALRSGGLFVFSLLHPCFDEVDSPQFPKGWRAKGYVRVEEYFQEFAVKQDWGYYFHRPLSDYLNLVIEQHCVIRKVVEPRLSPESISRIGPRNAHVPNFIVVSAVKMTGRNEEKATSAREG
jgi:2-polyprenyl-3-methyl-5-hydroxy-6-metoxy-1,4-benzoquinol methylase